MLTAGRRFYRAVGARPPEAAKEFFMDEHGNSSPSWLIHVF